MPQDMKTPAELAALADNMARLLKNGTSDQWSTLECPQVLAQLFHAIKPRNDGLASMLLSNVVDALAGKAGAGWVQPILQLYNKLLERGYHLGEKPFEFGCDASVEALAPVTSPMPPLGASFVRRFGRDTSVRTARIIVLRTQSLNFLVVLNEAYGRQRLHIRRFWDNLAEVQASGDYYPEQHLADSKDLTLVDALRLSTALSERYSDDIEGVSYPSRLSLKTILGASLFAQDETASAALRYGDMRDRGYVLSMESSLDECPKAKDMLGDAYPQAEYVAKNLASAVCCLEDGDA